MKNDKKKTGFSPTKKMFSAAAMLAVSASMLATSTYAWFSMNTTVTATGMQVQAKAEAGLVISQASDGTYNASASSAKSTVAVLKPGSTSNLTNWFHSTSSNPAAANTKDTYDAGTAWVASTNEDNANYVVHDFYIRSSSPAAIPCTSLNVTNVEAKVGNGPFAQNLSKALRVGIKYDIANDNNYYIYSPLYTGTAPTYYVTNQVGDYSEESGKRTSVTPKLSDATDSKDTIITSIPANDGTSTPIHAQIYIWFEGEDSNCISNNIQSVLEQLTVTVTFGYTAST